VLAKLAEVVGAPLDAVDLLEIGADRLVVEEAHRQGVGEPGQGVEQALVVQVLEVVREGLDQELGQSLPALVERSQGRGEEGLGHERVLARLVGDDGAAHLRRGEVVREVGAEEGSGAHPHVDEQIVEIEALQRFIERAEGADLVNGAFRRSRGEGQSDPGRAARAAGSCVAALHRCPPSGSNDDF
jgi:hypothetical protein